MNPIHIDFAPRTTARMLGRSGPATWLLGIAGIALCVSAGVMLQRQHDRNQLLQAQIDTVDAQVAERAARKPAPKKVLVTEAAANAINAAVLQLNLPWRDVLDAIEQATPPSVALLSIEPDAKKQFVRGQAEAKGSDEMIAYIEQLKKQEFFSDVLLTRHETNEQDPNRPLRFQFEAQWNKAAQ